MIDRLLRKRLGIPDARSCGRCHCLLDLGTVFVVFHCTDIGFVVVKYCSIRGNPRDTLFFLVQIREKVHPGKVNTLCDIACRLIQRSYVLFIKIVIQDTND